MLFSRSGRDPAKPFGAIAKDIFRRKKFLEKGRYGALEAAWREVVGDELAVRTHISSLRGGQLEVAVDSSVLLQELDGFMKTQILGALRATEAGRDVAGLRFRLGTALGARKEDGQEGPYGS
jgi:predicted nucleic acid-binding Zn ribbon protein